MITALGDVYAIISIGGLPNDQSTLMKDYSQRSLLSINESNGDNLFATHSKDCYVVMKENLWILTFGFGKYSFQLVSSFNNLSWHLEKITFALHVLSNFATK